MGDRNEDHDEGVTRVAGRRFARAWLRALPYLIPAILLLSVTLPHLWTGDFRTDTGRYASVGLSAWREGRLWTPAFQAGVPYFSKPPLVLWIHGWFLDAFGVTVFFARLPSVLAALGVVLATVATVRLFASRLSALMTGVVLALTLDFFRRTREISMDMWLTVLLIAAVWLVGVGVARRRPAIGFVGAGVAIGLALLCKPLVGLLAIPVLAAWLVWIGRPRMCAWLALSLTLAMLVAAPWHLSMAAIHGEAFTGAYFGEQIQERAAGRISVKPVWYYLGEFGMRYWPAIIPLVAGLLQWGRGGSRDRDPRGMKLAIAWTVGWLVMLSVFPDKRPRYALVLYPTMAWIAGSWIADRMGRPLRRAVARWGFTGATIVAVLAGLLSLAPIRIGRSPEPGFSEAAAYIRAHPDRALMAGVISENDLGRMYLKLGRWPEAVGGKVYPSRADVPADALWVHGEPLMERRLERERIVFQNRRLTVTEARPGRRPAPTSPGVEQ